MEQVRYEYRTSKVTAAIFQTQEQALAWLSKWETRDPKYARTLKLFRVTTGTQTERLA